MGLKLLIANERENSAMGYDVHITRKAEWFDDEPAITLGEWLSVVDADPEMRLDGFAEANLPDGQTLRLESEGLSVWTGYSGHNLNGGMAWFSYSDGNVTVKNPDDEIIGKMCAVAECIYAKVQGDEGEFYPLGPESKQNGGPK
jgi:hypothetical protein